MKERIERTVSEGHPSSATDHPNPKPLIGGACSFVILTPDQITSDKTYHVTLPGNVDGACVVTGELRILNGQNQFSIVINDAKQIIVDPLQTGDHTVSAGLESVVRAGDNTVAFSGITGNGIQIVHLLMFFRVN